MIDGLGHASPLAPYGTISREYHERIGDASLFRAMKEIKVGTHCGERPDSERTPNGADKVVLKAGLEGKAKTQFKGKGANLPALPLPLSLPATVQLQGENGACFEGVFSTTGLQLGTGTQFKGKAD